MEKAKINLLNIAQSEAKIKGSFCYNLTEFEKAIGAVANGKN